MCIWCLSYICVFVYLCVLFPLSLLLVRLLLFLSFHIILLIMTITCIHTYKRTYIQAYIQAYLHAHTHPPTHANTHPSLFHTHILSHTHLLTYTHPPTPHPTYIGGLAVHSNLLDLQKVATTRGNSVERLVGLLDGLLAGQYVFTFTYLCAYTGVWEVSECVCGSVCLCICLEEEGRVGGIVWRD